MTQRDDAQPPGAPHPHRLPHLGHPDASARKKLLWNARTLGARDTDPALYAHALRVFLTDADTECRNAAIWLMRDAWKRDRELGRGPLRAALVASAIGTPRRFWTRVASRLADRDARRTVAEGEHLQWLSRQADEAGIAALADDPSVAFRLVDAALAAAQDTAVRTYPRAAFVELIGRVARVSPDVRATAVEGLRALATTDPVYDIRYWVDRVLTELG